eukprot:TRINITY_DN13325_c0_g2_i1.p1 TRINITY_DN13325_c0_g2~~TRINITY_DN13325_c0_g2_i1.p1  ORF type:complete len:577 (-),score=37.47 TRINITY_DN13325_c0_g2_i1:179-1909(-)
MRDASDGTCLTEFAAQDTSHVEAASVTGSTFCNIIPVHDADPSPTLDRAVVNQNAATAPQDPAATSMGWSEWMPQCEDFRVGVQYVATVLQRSLLPSLLGVLLGVLPLSLSANAIARRITEFRSHNGVDTPISIQKWSFEYALNDSPSFDPLSYWTFWSTYHVCNRLTTYGSYFVVAVTWRGCTRRVVVIWLIGLIFALIAFGIATAMHELANRGYTEFVRRAFVPGTVMLYVLWFLGVFSCLLRCAPVGTRQQAARPIFVLLIVGAAIYLTLHIGVQQFFSAPQSLLRMMIFSFGARAVRALGVHAYIALRMALPNSNDETQLILVTTMTNMILTAAHLLQVSTVRHESLVLLQVFIYLGEQSVSLCFLSGETEIERVLRLGLAMWYRLRGMQSHEERVVKTAWTGTRSVQVRPNDVSVEENAEEAESDISGRPTLLANIISMSNMIEVITLLITTSWFLLLNINISAEGNYQQKLQSTVLNCVIILFFEGFSDASVVAFSRRWATRSGAHIERGVRTSYADLCAGQRSVSSRTVAWICALCCVSSVAFLGKATFRLCPSLDRSDSDSVVLKYCA